MYVFEDMRADFSPVCACSNLDHVKTAITDANCRQQLREEEEEAEVRASISSSVSEIPVCVYS